MHREVRKNKRFDTLANNRMTEINSSEASYLLNSHRDNADSDPEARILTQDKPN